MRVNRVWPGLVVLMLPTLLVAMVMTALLLALPRLSAALRARNPSSSCPASGVKARVDRTSTER